MASTEDETFPSLSLPRLQALSIEDNVSASALCPSCLAIKLDYLLPMTELSPSDAAQNPLAPPDAIFPRRRYRDVEGSLIWLPEKLDRDSDIDLGPLEEILLRAEQCPFCKLVISVLRRNKKKPPLVAATTLFGDLTHVFLHRFKIGDVVNFQEHESWGLCRYQILVKKPWNATRPFETGIIDPFKDSTTIQIGLSPATNVASADPTNNAFLGRVRDSKCDWELCKTWLNECLNFHGESCGTHQPVQEGSIRLINVDKHRLETFSLSKCVDLGYFALSYVWGRNAQRLTLTKNTLPQYQDKMPFDDLSTTIQDAIEVVRKFELQYIWVDALCLVQDDPEDQKVQIPLMTSIYQCALATIVAASGQDANSGLSGVNNDRIEQVTANLGRFNALSVAHDAYRVDETTWNSRAWTFQENVLSVRTILFFEDAMAWRCQTTQWVEDIDLEWRGYQFDWSRPLVSTEVSLRNYADLVDAYSQRSLTYEGDICNAFAGICGALAEEIWWGLPCIAFERYLTWEPGAAGKASCCRREQLSWIPSWSWFAWRGHINLGHGSLDATRTPEIVCYRWDSDIQDLTPILSALAEPRPPTTEQGEIPISHQCNKKDIPPNLLLSNTHIVFWASIAQFVVQTSESGHLSLFLPFPIPSSDTTFLGSLSPRVDCKLEDGSTHDFLLLRRHEGAMVHHVQFGNPADGPPRYVAPDRPSTRGADTCVVMLVSWDNGVAKREHVGEISDAARPFADAERRVIVLG